MQQTLSKQVAFVTGGASGIGRAISARLLEAGARVTIADIDEAAGEDAADELSGRGDVRFRRLDVSDPDAVAQVVADTVAWGGRLDLVVNDAMDMAGWGIPLAELSLGDWHRGIAVGLTGPMLVCRAAAPHLVAAKGSVVNITSTRAAMSEPNTETYAACKGGLTALTHAMAISFGPDVRVNAIAPGWIATDAWKPRPSRHEPKLSPLDHAQHPVGRVGTPEDVAAMVHYLATEAGFVTGQVFTLDGGMTRKMIYAD